jgi:hypothetical protein
METVFDLATPQELAVLFGEDDSDLPDHLRGYALERKAALEDADGNYCDLALLFANRGDKKRSDEYLANVRDGQRRLQTAMLLYECAEA